MADGYAYPLGDAAHPYPNTGDSLRRTDGVAWVAASDGTSRAGRRPGPGFALSLLTGPERVRVQPGRAVVTHPANGHYRVAVPGVVDVTLPTRPASGTSRIDYVIARVYDAAVDASTNLVDVRIEIVSGQAAASPAPPSTTPDGSLVLGSLTVPAGTAAIDVAASPIYTVAAGGIVPVANAADRDSLGLFNGLKVFRLDTGRYESRIGGAWVVDPLSTQIASDIAAAVAAVTPKFAGTEVAPIGDNPPAGTTKVAREGSYVATTTAGGGFVIPVGSAFTKGITYYELSPGDGASALDRVRPNLGSSTRTQLFGTALKADGSAVASAQIRVNWQAVGW